MKRIYFFACFFVFFLSCSSDRDDALITEPESNFYALTVGNSWVYKNYKYNNTTETYEDTGVVDSVSIIGTETIRDNIYYKFRRLTTGNEEGITLCNVNGEHFDLLRDSIGYLVDNLGKIRFTNNDFTERVLIEHFFGGTPDTVSLLETLMEGINTITVEAGSFDCINSERYIKNITTDETLPAKDKFYYADGFGLIHDTSSFASSVIPVIKRRLDSYEIN